LRPALKYSFFIYVIVHTFFSCSKFEENNEELANSILFSIMADNQDLFDKECKLLDQTSQRFMPPSSIFDNDSTFKAAIQDFISKEEMEDLIFQKHNVTKLKFLSKEIQSKYQLISLVKIDSLLQIEKPLKKADYWQIFQKDIGCLQFVSKILITKNKKTAIIKYGSLKGPHDGFGFLIIFQFKNNKWTIAKEIDYWVS